MALQKLVWVTAAPPAPCPPPPTPSHLFLPSARPLLCAPQLCIHLVWGHSGEGSEMPAPSHGPSLVSSTLSCGMRRIHGSNSLRTACEVSRAPEMAGKGGRGQCPPALGRSFMSSRVRRWWEASTGQPVCLPSAFVHPPDF